MKHDSSPIHHNPPLTLANDVPTMQNPRDPTQNRETNVDEEIGAAAAFEEDGDGWEEETEEVEADV